MSKDLRGHNAEAELRQHPGVHPLASPIASPFDNARNSYALRQRRPASDGKDNSTETNDEEGLGPRPSSFAESQFQTIVRRQRKLRI